MISQWRAASATNDLPLNLAVVRAGDPFGTNSRQDGCGAAAGQMVGGAPVLGYYDDPRTKQLIVQAEDAAQVRAIFELY